MHPFLVDNLKSCAHAILPQRLWQHLIKIYLQWEVASAGSMEKRFAATPLSLADFEPAYGPQTFAGGPIILVNNALAAGGVERQIVNTLRGLKSRSDRSLGLLCLYLGNEPGSEFFKPALASIPDFVRNAMGGTAATRVLGQIFPKSTRKRISRLIEWMPWGIQQQILRFAAEFATVRPQVVHAWQDAAGISATYAAKIIGVPRIIIETSSVRPTRFASYRPYIYFAHRAIAACPDIIMINNSETGAADYAHWLGLPINRFIVKRNGLDAATFRRADPRAVAELRSQLSIPPDSPVIGSMYRFSEEKQPFLWLETACAISKHQPRCQFVIFGTGPLKTVVETAANKRGLAHSFHCPGVIDDTTTGLSLFDVFLLTSKFEGIPNAVLEATAAGVPVVAVGSGATHEAIEQGVTGYMISRPDPEMIADCIIDTLRSPEWREQVRQRGPAFMQRCFGLDRMIAETEALYFRASPDPRIN
jgi:glycosyltransferase involved in cell wall biosynthesis